MSQTPEPYELFQKELTEYLLEYETFLSLNLQPATVRKHSMVIDYFIEFICLYHSATGFEDITFSMVSSKLYYSFEKDTQEGLSRKTVFNIIKRFLEFVYSRYGIQNPKLMQKMPSAKFDK